MFSRAVTLFAFLFLAFPLFTSASAIAVRSENWGSESAHGGGYYARGDVPDESLGGPVGGTTFKQCNTGKLQCCNSVQSASSTAAQKAIGLLTVPIGHITGQVGLTCNPISVIGINGNSCSAQPACCTGNSFGGGGLIGSLVVVGCTPVNANL